MQYLDKFFLPSENDEFDFRCKQSSLYYTNNSYPIGIFSNKNLFSLEFEPITIIYGSNGSGKSTLLNLIADKTNIFRQTPYNKTPIFTKYSEMCEYQLNNHVHSIPSNSEIITSDGVFDFLLDIRSMNDGNAQRRADLYEEYNQIYKSKFRMKSLDDYDKLKQFNEVAKGNVGQYVARRVPSDIEGRSNGENAYLFFTEHIKENALYLLDEPENSMSAPYQRDLAKFIQDSVRFYKCQFIIATHSPFLLSIPYAKIYDLDSNPCAVKEWYELENMKIYWQLFSEHSDEFI